MLKQRCTQALENLLSLSSEIEARMKELEEKEKHFKEIEDKLEKQHISKENLLSLSEIEERMKELEEKEKRFKEIEDKMVENANKAKSKVTLDVGGTKFATSKSTLLQFDDSYFSAMLGSDRWKPDEDGSYFIDRDPKYFGVILNFMRTGKIYLKTWSIEDLEALKEDLDYYQIKIPEGEIPITWNLLCCSPKIKIEGNVITKIGDGWGCGVLGNLPNPKSFKFMVDNVLIPRSGNFMVGFVPKNTNINSQIHSFVGWMIYDNPNSLYSPDNQSKQKVQYPQFKNRDVVEILYDQPQKCISLSINGQSYGVCFKNMTVTTDLYICCEIYRNGSSIELL